MDSSEYLLLPVLNDPNIYLSYDPNLDSGISSSSSITSSKNSIENSISNNNNTTPSTYFNDSSPLINFPSSPPISSNHAFTSSPIMSSTTLTSPILTSSTLTMDKITTIQTTLPSAIQSNPPYLHNSTSPQTHEHFLKLLNQIQQHHQQSSTFQNNHDKIINAHAVASQSNSSTSSPNLLVPLIDQPTTLLTSDPMTLDQTMGNITSFTDLPSIVPTITINTSSSSVPILNNKKSNTTRASASSSIQSPPNSPRKSSSTRINNKIKAKTQQVQQNIQQNLSPNSSSSTTPTLSPTMNNTGLSGFNLQSTSPPLSPPLAPPVPNIGSKSPSGSGRKSNLRNVGPNVSSIINQLGYGNAASAASSISNSPSNSFVNNPCTDLSTSQTNLSISTNSTTVAPNNEDKKAICLGFLKYFFNVNLQSPTPSLRRSLILSLYVNKIPQEQRYRRPNDMANLCVVLYGFLYSSLDEPTIKEFINTHSSSSTKSKKEDKKKKRKRDNKNHTNNNHNNNNSNQHDDTDQPSTKSFKPNSSLNSLDNWTSLDLSNSNLEQQSQMDIDNSSNNTNSNNNNNNNTDDDDDPPVSLHDAFINCLKSCNLLPFLEFKPVQLLQLPNDLPISDYYYTFDDLIRWENELKDLKLSVKQQTQHQLKLQKHQQLLQQSQSNSPQLSNSTGNVPLTPSFLSLQHQVITPSNSSSSLLGDLQPQSPITQSINTALSLPILSNSISSTPTPTLNCTNSIELPSLSSNNIISSNNNPTSPPTLPSPTISSNSIDTSIFNSGLVNSLSNSGTSNWTQDNSKSNGVLVNVYESDESFVIYVAIPHSQTNSLKVTVNQLEIIVEGIISIPETIYLPNGTEITVPVSFPLSNTGLQRQEFLEGSFTKQIKLSSPVSSSVVGKREGVIVIIARKETSQPQFIHQL